eukprot:scaffold80846_cov34-Prasinocladus_malaysianus.AAC.1
MTYVTVSNDHYCVICCKPIAELFCVSTVNQCVDCRLIMCCTTQNLLPRYGKVAVTDAIFSGLARSLMLTSFFAHGELNALPSSVLGCNHELLDFMK